MDRRHFCRLILFALISTASGCKLLPEKLFEEDKEPDQETVAAPEVPKLKEAMFYEKIENNKVRCKLCFRECAITEGSRGFCRNRENRQGTLYSLVYGRPSALQFDPVEKEPLHHFLPATDILCIGTASCNFRCKFCHNWHLSQRSIEEIGFFHELAPEAAVQMTLDRLKAHSISFTYNEPTVFYEYVYDIAKQAQKQGVRIVFHSNGSMNPGPLRALLQHVDAVTIDLKAFDEGFYREISRGDLQHVLGTLKIIKEAGVWLEIVNLVVPGLNDDLDEIREMCRWIGDNLGSETPLHFSRLFPACRLTDLAPTPVQTLEKAHDAAREEGLLFVIIGNVPGHRYNSTFCPGCGETLIERHHFSVLRINLEEGRCRFCGYRVAGVWQQKEP